MSPSIRLRKDKSNLYRDRMLDFLCGYLNQTTPDEAPNYVPADWTSASTHGEDQFVIAYETDWYLAVVWSVYDGDDGGGSTLTGYFSKAGTSPPLNNEHPPADALWYLTHEFDTNLNLIVDEGKLIKRN